MEDALSNVYVRAPYLLIFWEENDTICADARSGRRFSLPVAVINVLIGLRDPQRIEQIAASFNMPVSLIKSLVNASLLVPDDAVSQTGWTVPELYFQRLSNSGGSFARGSASRSPIAPSASTPTLLPPRRPSTRQFTDETIFVSVVSEILDAVLCPYMDDTGEVIRPYPSGGGLYAVRLYVQSVRIAGLEAGVYLRESGSYHYMPGDDGAAMLSHVVKATECVGPGPAAIVILTGNFEAPLLRYKHIAVALLHKEAGAVLQLLSMAAAAYGLGGCVVGTVPDSILTRSVSIDLMHESGLAAFTLGIRR